MFSFDHAQRTRRGGAACANNNVIMESVLATIVFEKKKERVKENDEGGGGGCWSRCDGALMHSASIRHRAQRPGAYWCIRRLPSTARDGHREATRVGLAIYCFVHHAEEEACDRWSGSGCSDGDGRSCFMHFTSPGTPPGPGPEMVASNSIDNVVPHRHK